MRIKAIALISAAVMLITVCVSAQYPEDRLASTLDDAVYWAENNFSPALNPQFDGSSYQIMAAARMGRNYDYSSYLQNMETVVSGYTPYTPASVYATAALAVEAAGGDPGYFAGRNLLSDGIYNRAADSPLIGGDINEVSRSLIALDACNSTLPDYSSVTKDDMVTAIVNECAEDGSIGTNAYNTALALTALSNHIGEAGVSADIINSAVDYLSTAQGANGDFGDLETTALVSMALNAIGIDGDTDTRFIKNNNSIIDGIMSYIASDGSFYAYSDHTGEATGIASCALTSHIRMTEGSSDFYDFTSSDVPQILENLNPEPTPEDSNNNSNNESSSNSENDSSNNSAPSSNSSNSGSSNSSSSSSGTIPRATIRPAATARPSSTIRPSAPGTSSNARPTIMPRVTIPPRATITPSSPKPMRTPHPTKKPELVGPVRLPGPQLPPTPTPEADEFIENADSILHHDTISVPIAVGVIALLALAGLVTAFVLNIKPKKKNNKPFHRKKQSDIYRAKIHRRTEIHGAYKTREKYKERGKYKGSYRK